MSRRAIVLATITASIVAIAAVGVGTAQPVPGQATTPDIRGWAFLGKHAPIIGATVTIRTPKGRVIPGLRTRTGPDGSFAIDTEGTPRLAMRWAEVRVSGGWSQGYRKGMRMKIGPLYSRVTLTGPAAGLVYVTPVSSLSALLVRNERWSIARADRMARKWWGLPEIPQSAFAPWRDGGVSTQYSTRYIDPKAVLADAATSGGITDVVDGVRQRGEDGRVATYGAGDDEAARHTAHNVVYDAVELMKSSPWGVVAEITRACNPAQTLVPGLGIVLTAVRNSISSEKTGDPLCGLDRGMASRLGKINSQLSAINQALVEQSQQISQLSQSVRSNAFSQAQLTLSNTVAAILTIDEDSRLLAAMVERYTSPASATNREGLGMTLEEIAASTEPRAQAAVRALRNQADNAYGPRLPDWRTAPERLAQPGVLLPGSTGELGIVRQGWNALFGGDGSTLTAAARLDALTRYYRSLNAMLAMQRIDALRSDGVPEALVSQRVGQQQALDRALASLVPDRTVGDISPQACPQVIDGSRPAAVAANPATRHDGSGPPGVTAWQCVLQNFGLSYTHFRIAPGNVRICRLDQFGGGRITVQPQLEDATLPPPQRPRCGRGGCGRSEPPRRPNPPAITVDQRCDAITREAADRPPWPAAFVRDGLRLNTGLVGVWPRFCSNDVCNQFRLLRPSGGPVVVLVR